MPDIQDNGIIVQSLNYSETSLILTWFTERHGVISTLAKGARRPKQKLQGKTDLFYQATLTYRPAKENSSSHLHHLKEIEIISQHNHIKKSYQNLLAATAYYELISHLVEHNTPIPEFYDLFNKAIHYLSRKPPSPKILHRYERRLYQLLGLDDGNLPLEVIRKRSFYQLPKSLTTLEKIFFIANNSE